MDASVTSVTPGRARYRAPSTGRCWGPGTLLVAMAAPVTAAGGAVAALTAALVDRPVLAIVGIAVSGSPMLVTAVRRYRHERRLVERRARAMSAPIQPLEWLGVDPLAVAVQDLTVQMPVFDASAEAVYVEFVDAELWNAELWNAELWNAELTDLQAVHLELTDLELTDLAPVPAEPAHPELTDLEPVPAEPAHPELADVDWADLQWTDVEWADVELWDEELAGVALAATGLGDSELGDPELADADPADPELADAVGSDVPGRRAAADRPVDARADVDELQRIWNLGDGPDTGPLPVIPDIAIVDDGRLVTQAPAGEPAALVSEAAETGEAPDPLRGRRSA